ncbi:MAG: hypothetical protein J5994_01750 [Ruminococcus sp.]|nr:hypothetical protein [Ruminococcus sp.]
MSKLCKSCGNYYDGDHCDKCGYGKDSGTSKAAEKYKKARKPKRFRTAEDDAVYAKWDKEKQQNVRVRDPNANRNFLIVCAVVVIGLIVFVLYQSGAFFKNTREDVVKQYFTAIQEGDYDSFLKCFPKEIKESYEDERKSLGLSKEEAMEEMYGNFKDEYGDGYKIEVEIGRQTKLDSDDYDMTEYYQTYGVKPSLSEVYDMSVSVRFSGESSSEEAQLYINVAKVSGRWRIFGLTENVGTVTEDTGLAVQGDDGGSEE